MSDDLISRSLAIENIWSLFNSIYNNSAKFETEETALARRNLVDVQRVIENQPSAFNAKKVIQKLENEKTNFIGMGTLQSAYFDKGIDKAIEIVKSGGVADD